MRLQKFLARCGVASRRKCEALIAEGRVCVNGSVVTEMGTTVDPLSDVVTFDGSECKLPDESVTLMLNKPTGYLTAMQDARNQRLVAELVPQDDYPGLFPVGRLDRDTSGLLLFTTDGELGNALLHPSRNVTKRYVAEVEGKLSDEEVRQLESGVVLENGLTAPATCEVLGAGSRRGTSRVALEIHEGRKRQVRRMFHFVGHEVITLHRESFGPLKLGTLEPGKWRILSPQEAELLKRAASI